MSFSCCFIAITANLIQRTYIINLLLIYQSEALAVPTLANSLYLYVDHIYTDADILASRPSAEIPRPQLSIDRRPYRRPRTVGIQSYHQQCQQINS